jgi:hypothetical protein
MEAKPAPLPKELQSLRASLSAALVAVLPKEPVDSSVFLPRPKTLRVFTDDILDTLLDTVKADRKSIRAAGVRFGGRLLLLNSPEAANALAKAFTPPVQIVHYGTTHIFTVAPTPRTHDGVRVRVTGLPLTCTPDNLRDIAAVLANDSELLHYEILRTRGGTQIDRGIIIFNTCPSRLLHISALQVGPYRLQFSFLNDVICGRCKRRGHSDHQCSSAQNIPMPLTEYDTAALTASPPPPRSRDLHTRPQAY